MSDFKEPITALRKSKRLLEERLRTTISEQVSAFERETGVAVSDVYVSFTHIYTFGAEPKDVVDRVSVSLEEL